MRRRNPDGPGVVRFTGAESSAGPPPWWRKGRGQYSRHQPVKLPPRPKHKDPKVQALWDEAFRF